MQQRIAPRERFQAAGGRTKQGRAYDMASLLNKYLSEKGVPGDGYKSKRLKDRLKSSFAEEIAFHQQQGKAKPELVYSSNVKQQEVINAWAIAQSYQVNNNSRTQIWLYVCIGNSMVFKIVTQIWDNFEISREVLSLNTTNNISIIRL